MSSHVIDVFRAQVAAGATRTALQDRFWTMGSAGSIPEDVLAEIPAGTGGLVLTGATAAAAAREVRAQRPDLPLLLAPTSADQRAATAEKPFVLLDDEVLFSQTVQEVLTQQRDAGADMVITPSGQVEAQDAAALKAVIAGANQITEPDVLTLVVVQAGWLVDPWIGTLCSVLRDSEHPVLLGLADSFANPLDARGALAGYQRVAHEVGTVVGWHTDLSGLGFVGNGGLGAAIGLRPSGRRHAQLGLHPKSSDKRDKTPHVLLPELMRYTRSSHMQKEWFAQASPDICSSACCAGRAVDRFDGSNESVAAAHVHNTTVLYELVDAFSSVASPSRHAWWRKRVNDAIAAHTALGERIRREVKLPTDLERWSDLLTA